MSDEPQNEKKKPKLTILECYNLWLEDKEACEEAMKLQEPSARRREELYEGFERIAKAEVNRTSVPSWWK